MNGITSIYEENIRYVNGLEIIDDYTLKITLDRAVPFFEYNLTFPIMSEDYFAGEDFKTTEKNIMPIGTGMFKIQAVETNIIRLVKNEVYWDNTKKPMVEEVEIKLFSSIGEVYNAFKSGELDLVIVKSNNVEEYIGTLGYNKIEYKAREYDFLAFNTLAGVYTDSAVRKAISLIIDKDLLVASCLGNGYISSNFSLDMGHWLYTRDLTVTPNVDEAKNILKTAGWIYKNNTWIKDGQRLTLNITVNSNNASRVRVAEVICDSLNNFGIQSKVVSLDVGRYVDSLNNKNFECILTGIEASFSPSLHTFFGEGNLASYTNPEVLDLINKTENTTDENIMHDSYRTIYDRYIEEVPYIGLYRNTDILIYHQGLVGNISPNTFNVFHNIEKWYRQ